MPVTWEQSGDRALKLTLEDVQQLALASGYVFPNTTPDLPLARRANLQALFNDFNVNSASAFIRLFTTTSLRPPGAAVRGSKLGGRGLPQQPGPSTWVVQETDAEVYMGELRDGRWHGSGLLLTKGSPTVLYVGAFQDGRRHGLGEVHTSRGESFQGYFNSDTMLGPARYVFPRPQSKGPDAQAGATGPRAMARFEGLFNGRPDGKGVLYWEDGEEEAGEFDGSALLRPLPWQDIEGVVLVAGSNAQQARAQSEAIRTELKRQHGGLWERAVQLIPQLSDSFLQC